jgi:hypothetical protein
MDTTHDYPGKTEILAAWRWGISYTDDGRPITTMGEAADAMDLAYRAFEQRDEARTRLAEVTEQLDDVHNRTERIRAEVLRALADRDTAREERDRAIDDVESGHEMCDADLEAQKQLTRVALRAPKMLAAAAVLLIALVHLFN